MQFQIDPELATALEEVRAWGQSAARPAGLEADRNGMPLPTDHPYFQAYLAKGYGATTWQKDPSAKSFSVVRRVCLAEESAYWDRGMDIANPGVGLPEGLVLSTGTEAQKEKFLTNFINPDKPRWASLAMTEPGGGSDTAAFKTKAIKAGRHWILSGAKCFIGNASRADWILVQATVEPDKPRGHQRSFFVEKDTPGLGGFKIEKKMGLKAYESTSFMLDECRIPADHLLGGESVHQAGGHGRAMRTLNATRPIVAANAVGMARAASDAAEAFAKTHALHEDVRSLDRLERFRRKLRGAWLLTLKAAWLADQGQPNITEASMAKAMSADVVQEITQSAMNMLGTVAARGDHIIEKLFRDAKAMNIVEGTGQIQRLIIARNLVGRA